MDLRSDRPYWPTTCRRPRLRSTSPRRARVDVLIVGAGITGALTAYELTKVGLLVAVVDSRPAGSGSTPASTALLQYEIDTPLVKLAAQLGNRHANAAYTATRRSLQDMRHISRDLGDTVEMTPRQSLHLAVKPTDVRTFRAEVAARRRLGIPVQLLQRKQLRDRFGFDRPGAILSDEGFEINPLKLTYQLLTAARERSAIMLPRTRLDLSRVVASARPFRFTLPDGATISADRIVMATGYETPEQFKVIAGLTELRSTFALATTPLSGQPWPTSALLWDAGDPYFYARSTADGRILIGGEDQPFTSAAQRDALIHAKSRTLMKKLRTLVPRLDARAAYCWAGTFAHTKDGLPYIGEHERWPGIWFALGYGGNGITFSGLAAKIIATAAIGKAHPAARLFRFDR